ncbi:hypothetical protein DPQ25_10430 [Hydrogeniiclostridium mannosilyticum]|uniref:Uncharacterized protein n=1 Tax=Hydrogeniiclostridium mannosilyticum TaxID=2764322 RepID=A0A328UDJ1_9FIRM|nr:hypothetical protein DPQ25_10430 [Hydrogeniiclostridium mannosilyticum]
MMPEKDALPCYSLFSAENAFIFSKYRPVKTNEEKSCKKGNSTHAALQKRKTDCNVYFFMIK